MSRRPWCIGTVNNGYVRLSVLDDMAALNEQWPRTRIAIEMSQPRIGLNRAELAQHIAHCQAALELFS